MDSLGRALSLTTHSRLVPRLRMHGIILWFLHTPLWRYLYLFILSLNVKVKVECSRYRPGVAHLVGRGIALLFHDRGTRRRWVVSSTPSRTLPPGKTRYPLYRRLGGPQGRSGRAKILVPTGIRSRTVQSVAQSLYRLSYLFHEYVVSRYTHNAYIQFKSIYC